MDEWRKKCPITRLTKVLVEQYACTQEELDAIVKEIREYVLAASKRAKSGAEPNVAELADDLYNPTFQEITWKPFVKQ